jgi:hypothetical protein
MTKEEIEVWLADPETRARLEEALEEARRNIAKFNQATRVPWQVLMEPMTI